jgi:hypothetical protein
MKGWALSTNCDVCRKIEGAYKTSRMEYYYKTLRSITDVLASKCGVHSPLIEYFVEKHHLDGFQKDIVIAVNKELFTTSISLFVESVNVEGPVDWIRRSELMEVMQKSGFKRHKFGFGKS